MLGDDSHFVSRLNMPLYLAASAGAISRYFERYYLSYLPPFTRFTPGAHFATSSSPYQFTTAALIIVNGALRAALLPILIERFLARASVINIRALIRSLGRGISPVDIADGPQQREISRPSYPPAAIDASASLRYYFTL